MSTRRIHSSSTRCARRAENSWAVNTPAERSSQTANTPSAPTNRTPRPMPSGLLSVINTSRRAHTIPPWSAPWARVASRKLAASPGCCRSDRSAAFRAVSALWSAMWVVTNSPCHVDGNDRIRAASGFDVVEILRHHPAFEMVPHLAHRVGAEFRTTKYVSVCEPLPRWRKAAVEVAGEHPADGSEGRDRPPRPPPPLPRWTPPVNQMGS